MQYAISPGETIRSDPGMQKPGRLATGLAGMPGLPLCMPGDVPAAPGAPLPFPRPAVPPISQGYRGRDDPGRLRCECQYCDDDVSHAGPDGVMDCVP